MTDNNILIEEPACFLGIRGWQEAKVLHNSDNSYVEVETPGRIKIPILSLFSKKEKIVLNNIGEKVKIDKVTYEKTGEGGLLFWCDIQGNPYVASADNSLFTKIQVLQRQLDAERMKVGSLQRELIDLKSDSRLKQRMIEDAKHSAEVKQKLTAYWETPQAIAERMKGR